MKKRKLALFQSVISLLLCFSMLVGTTFAWFTDSVATGMNTIAAGNLDVEIFHTNAAVTDQRVDSATKLFLDLQGDPILWEPGVVSYENLRVANEGDLALAYQLLINTAGENHVLDPESGAKYGLSQILKVGVVENGITATDRDGVVASVEDANWTTLADFIRSGSLLPEGAGESEKTWGIVIYWEPGEDDNRWNLNNGKELDQGEYLMIDLGIRLVATQEQFESDSFGSDYDANAKADVFPEFAGGTASSPVESDGNGGTAAEVTMSSGAVSATVPAGAKLAEGAKELTLSVAPMSASGANITLSDNEAMRSLDVHIEGLAADNTVPVTVTLTEAAPKGLNMGNYKLYHVEDGATVEMILVDSAADFTAHNQFKYDPATGDIVLYMATFSEVALVADTTKAWEGAVVTDWYNDSDEILYIANADDFAGLGELVVNGNNFSGKTVTLINNVNMGGDEVVDDNGKLKFYPIGYSAEGFKGQFSGTFDGTGHTVSNIFQNTWMLAGTYGGTYYNAAMGLFGYVNGGTIKNLTVDSFKSEGEFAVTGCVAAYAANATFENIAITNSHPATYNTSVAAVVGRDGKNGLNDNDGYNLIFRNITVDSTNIVSALWGSWDVGAAGLLGYLGSDSKVLLENCNVSATIDVYNDVCGNYQYYWYRYCGMLIGTVDKTKADGSLDLSNITAKNCTVDFGDRHEYYYCEFVKNTIASYTHDYQFSRVDNTDIMGSGDSATCQNHNHEGQGYETIDGKEVLVEDKQAVYIPFRQIFGGYGWGVKGTEITEEGIKIDDITVNWTEEPSEEDRVKFETKFTGDFLYRVGNQNAVNVGSLFKYKDNIAEEDQNGSGVVVTIDNYEKDANVGGTFNADTSDWTKGTIQFSGTGLVKITIQDYNYCTPTELIVEVVDATNVPENGKISNYGTTSVLLGNTSVSTLYLNDGATLYGNGFTIDCTNSPTSGTGSVSENYIIALTDAHLNNVKVVGKVYTEYGAQAANDYNRALVVTKGNCTITNCILSNTASPIRLVEGNLNVVGTTVKGGNFANIDVRNGHLTVEDVTTINQANGNDKAENGTTVVGLGIVVYYENVDPALTSVTIKGTLTQNNLISSNDKFSSTYAQQLVDEMMKSEYSAYQTKVDNVTWVNSGIIAMCSGVTPKDERTDKAGYSGTTVSFHGDGYVYTVKPNADSIDKIPSDTVTPEQGAIAPEYSFDYTTKNYIAKVEGSNDYCYYEGGRVLIAMDQGDTFEWDPFILTVTKNGKELDYTVSYNDKTYAAGEKITFDADGNYVVTYTYTDWDNYDYNAEGVLVKKEKTYTKTVDISVTVVTPTTQPATFTFNGTQTEKITVNNNTYISAKGVSATDQEWGYITVNGTKIFYPIIEAMMKTTSNWLSSKETTVYYPVYGAVTITDPENENRNSSSTSVDRLDVVNGMEAKYTSISSACVDISNLTKDGPSGEVWDFSASSTNSATIIYDEVLCYQSPSGLTVSNSKRNYNAITVAQFKYTDSIGDYYYFVGYYMPNQYTAESGGSGGGGTCIAEGSMITLADGSKKAVENLRKGDVVMAFDHVTGEIVYRDVLIVGKTYTDRYYRNVFVFDDGTELAAINEHGIYDLDLGKYVNIGELNYQNYLGHRFASVDSQGNIGVKRLIDVVTTIESGYKYDIVTNETLNYVVEDTLSVSHELVIIMNSFDFGDDMLYDAEAMQADIEKYGLYTYEDFAVYCDRATFEQYNMAMMKVGVGKGIYTYDHLVYLLTEIALNDDVQIVD